MVAQAGWVAPPRTGVGGPPVVVPLLVLNAFSPYWSRRLTTFRPLLPCFCRRLCLYLPRRFYLSCLAPALKGAQPAAEAPVPSPGKGKAAELAKAWVLRDPETTEPSVVPEVSCGVDRFVSDAMIIEAKSLLDRCSSP